MSSIVNEAKGVASTFTSWDSCMSKTYCKWPVIAAIIVAALIVFSILWCLFSCLCCGITLCNACVQCVTCCGCCGACGNKGGRGGRTRNKDPEYQPMPPTPTPYQGYQPQAAPMVYNGHGQQFATFNASSKSNTRFNEDSLPHMPTWDSAPTRQVEDHSIPEGHDVEMDRIQPQPQQQQLLPSQRNRGAYSQVAPSSPIREDYHQAQPHGADIGAQRLQTQQTDHYDEFQDTPLSPAPTYYSTVPPPAGSYSRQAHPQHVASPPPQSYYSSTAPYPSTRESTLFEAQSSHNSYAPRSISPPSQPSYSPYQSYHAPQQDAQGVRPPSLLMVGRKPVAGSYREV